jgi:predicted Fe-S protein YdhL (DUF1289 family)
MPPEPADGFSHFFLGKAATEHNIGPMKSPCIKLCRIDRTSGLCAGCLRSLEEIAGWASYSDRERHAILADLARRTLPDSDTGAGA